MKDFKQLLSTIGQVHQNLQVSAANAVNKALALRNWLIGFYIVEFEQNGEDRAKSGRYLLSSIAKEIKIKGLTTPELSRCRQFYQVYPQILGTVSQEFELQFPKSIFGTLSQKKQTLSGLLNVPAIRRTVPPNCRIDFKFHLIN